MSTRRQISRKKDLSRETSTQAAIYRNHSPLLELEFAARRVDRWLEHRAQHGPVRILVKNGKPVEQETTR